MVFEKSLERSIGTKFENKLEHTSDRDFPDIVAADFFGVEVKATKKDDWTSIGNSVLESSRVKSVEKIYILFGKLGGDPDIKIRNYEECLKGIAVTHYPRYQIDMNLGDGESIFDKMSVPYQELRTEKNPVKKIRGYYKSHLQPGEELWWINDDLDDSTSPSPVIKFFSSLSPEDKERIKAEVFVYIPEILSSRGSKYNKAVAYLISAHGVLSPNFRDNFSAGGQVEIDIKGKKITIPRIFDAMRRLKQPIINQLEKETLESLKEIWQEEPIGENTLAAWLSKIDKQVGDSWRVAKPSEIFSED